MAAELAAASITRSFLASIHREASTEPAFSTLIHHTVGVTLLMVDSNVKDLRRFTLLHMNVSKPGTSSGSKKKKKILGLHFIFLQRQNFYQARSQFLVAKRISMYS